MDLLPKVTLKYTKPLYTLGQHLKQARVKHKLSQPKLARKFGVNTATICQWENDNIKNILPKYYPLFAEFLGFCFVGDINKATIQKSQRLYQGLSQKEYAQLIGKSSRDVCKFENKI